MDEHERLVWNMKSLSCATDLADIRARIALVGAEDIHLWGSMTAPQMLCHLRDAFTGALGQLGPAPVQGSSLPAPAYKPTANPIFKSIYNPIFKSIFKSLALWLPFKWPPGVRTPPRIDQRIGGTPPAEFEADRAALLRKLDEFAGGAGPWVAHPMFGVMTAREWMRWGYLHADHHLRQFGH
jgi:hypothetical protein